MCVTLVTAATKWHRTPAEFDTRLRLISIENYADRDEKSHTCEARAVL